MSRDRSGMSSSSVGADLEDDMVVVDGSSAGVAVVCCGSRTGVETLEDMAEWGSTRLARRKVKNAVVCFG